MLVCVHKGPEGEVWRCDWGSSTPPAQTLSEAECARAQRFYREEDRQRFIASHVALRAFLADKLGDAPERLVFSTGAHGKPFLPAAPHCHFNLSHSGSVALIAYSADCAVGVDIEQARELRDIEGLVRRHFTPAEQLAWQNLPVADRHRAFHQNWARKEACVKAVGWGLHLPLETVDVGLSTEHAEVVCDIPNQHPVRVDVCSLAFDPPWAAAFAWVRDEAGTRHVHDF